MGFSARDSVRAEIMDTLNVLNDILHHYPQLYDEWQKKTDEEFKKVARDFSDGDSDVERSIYHSESAAFEKAEEMKARFYNAIFLITYGHVESCLKYMTDEVPSKHTGNNSYLEKYKNKILEKVGAEMPKDVSAAYSFFNEGVRPLRNKFAHNGVRQKKPCFNKSDELELEHIKKYFPSVWDDEGYLCVDSNMVSKSLQEATILLDFFCNITGHEVKYSNIAQQ